LNVQLTHGGWAYYFGVLDEVDYMLEMLAMQGLPRRHADLLSGRVEHAAGQLEKLLIMGQHVKVDDEYFEAICRGVIPDLIVRFTPGLVRAVVGHFVKMQDPRTMMNREVRFAESLHTREVMTSWLELLRTACDDGCRGTLSEHRVAANVNWQIMPLGRTGGFKDLGPTVGAWSTRWHAAILRVEKLLQGERLWIRGFPADSHREPLPDSGRLPANAPVRCT
jgi:hypothetical protein